MAWQHYYVCDSMPFNSSDEDPSYIYESKIPPHGSIRREWTTQGMKHGDAEIRFVEYRLEDDDPDGVWEAYGQKRESEYSFTVNAEQADPEKLFVYTLYKDGTLRTGFDIDTEAACAILTFSQPWELSAQQVAAVAEKVKVAPGYAGVVEKIVVDDLLDGRTDVPCLAIFQR